MISHHLYIFPPCGKKPAMPPSDTLDANHPNNLCSSFNRQLGLLVSWESPLPSTSQNALGCRPRFTSHLGLFIKAASSGEDASAQTPPPSPNPPAPPTVHPGIWTPNETERRHNVTDQWQSDWIGGGGGHCKSSDYFAVLCLRCGKVTQSFDWRLWVRQFIYCQAVGERTEAPRALNPVCSHLLEPARNVNSSRLSD